MTTSNRAALDRPRPGPPPARRPARPAARASSTSGSAPSTGRTRPSTPRPRPPAPASRGASSPWPRGPSVAPMRAQDCLYSVTDLAPGAGTTRVVGAVVEALRDAAGRRRGSTELLRSPEVTTVTLTVTEKGYSRRAGRRRWTPRRPASPPTSPRRPRPSRTWSRSSDGWPPSWRPGSAPAARRSTSCPATTPPATAPRWPGWCAEFVAGVGLARPRRGARLARDVGRRSRTRSSTGSSRPPPTADRDAAAAALGVRDEMAVVGEPYRQWVLRGRLRRGPAALGARRRARRPGRRALPADEAAPAQRLALGDGLPRGGRGLHDRRRRAGDRVGRAVGPRRSAPRSRRPCPTPGSTPASATSTTWSPGSATRPCTTCCARSGPTGR